MSGLNLAYLLPEWMALGILLVSLLSEIIMGKQRPGGKFAKTIPYLQAFGAVSVFIGALIYAGKIGVSFGGMFLLDPFASFFKALFSIMLVGIIFMTRDYFGKTSSSPYEFYMLLWSIVVGLFFLVSANDLLLLFISLEIVTMSFYILSAYLKRENLSIEAGLKYLILGSLASAFFVFGIGLVYVSLGSTALPDIRTAFGAHAADKLLILGLLFIISGLGFKVAAAPFHLWVPDVYQGAPTPVTAFLAVGSKAAGFAVLMRLLFTVFPDFQSGRVFLFSLLAVMTLLYGNLGALVQTNIKRLFGYSSIGHAGYMLIAIAAGTEFSAAAILYYLIAYGVTNLAAFTVVTLVGRESGNDEISAYSGLAKRSPFLAAAFFIALMSLAGVPPLAGFFGKFLVLLGAVKAGLSGLALLGALLVAVSLFYYLSVIRRMYLDEPTHEDPVSAPLTTRVLLGVLIAAILVVGIWQAPFYTFCRHAAAALF